MKAALLQVLLAAGGVGALSLEEVLASAERAFPALAAAQADLETADAEALAARGAFDPVWKTRATGVPVSGYPQARVDSVVELPTPLWGANLFAGYRLGAGKVQPYYGERETLAGGEVRAGLSIPLLRNGPLDRRRVNEAKAELGQAVSGHALEQQRLEVRRVASQRYYEWLAAGARRDVALGLLRLAEERDAQLATRSKAGDVATVDQRDNARSVAQRRAQVAQAERALQQAALELSLFVRDDAGRPVVPAPEQLGPLPSLAPAGPSKAPADLGHRPDLQRLERQLAQARLELELARNQLLPALDFSAAASKDLGGLPRPELAASAPAELELSLTLEVPLRLRAPEGRLRAAEAAVRKLERQLQQASERAAVEVADARSALTAGLERLELAREEVGLARQVEEGERVRFSLGESSLLFVNQREQATAEARQRELDAWLDGLRAAASLKAALAEATSKG
ncbi:MAG: TolC family protein [Myxococcaceae bacterium]|nr:TolC family protein [Myxococcaceae bacterium]